MLLSQLLAPYVVIAETHDRHIRDLYLSSREVKPGALFFAYPGVNADGRNFIREAIDAGAVAIVEECEENSSVYPKVSIHALASNVVVISLPNVKDKVGPIAQIFYDYPAKNMQVIGVTGTSGKTSITYIMA